MMEVDDGSLMAREAPPDQTDVECQDDMRQYMHDCKHLLAPCINVMHWPGNEPGRLGPRVLDPTTQPTARSSPMFSRPSGRDQEPSRDVETTDAELTPSPTRSPRPLCSRSLRRPLSQSSRRRWRPRRPRRLRRRSRSCRLPRLPSSTTATALRRRGSARPAAVAWRWPRRRRPTPMATCRWSLPLWRHGPFVA